MPHACPNAATRAAFRNEWRALVDEFGTTSKRLKGDDGLGWHSNIGCVLQFGIGSDGLEQRAFGAVEMALDCDEVTPPEAVADSRSLPRDAGPGP